MKKIKIILALIPILLIFPIAGYAAQINSTSYKQSVIVSVGGESINSTSYKTALAIGIIAKIINSTSYINRLGFFHTWLLANNQPCASDSQCEGGYCCSSACQSAACSTPSPTPTPETGGGGGSGSGGGGGGGSSGFARVNITEEEKALDFSISPGSIKEQLILNAAKTRELKIRNTGSVSLDFSLDVITISDMALLSDTSFSLSPGEEKVVEVNLIGKKLGSYFGEIKAAANGITKQISVVLEVESEQALFDIKMDIPSAYKEVMPGGELKTQITLLNVGPPKKVDVAITYIIKNKKGNIVHESSETFAIDRQSSFVKSFKIPEHLEPGDYIAVVEVRYESSFAVSSELFRVVSKKSAAQQILKSKPMIALAAVLVAFVILLAYLLLPKMKLSMAKRKRK